MDDISKPPAVWSHRTYERIFFNYVENKSSLFIFPIQGRMCFTFSCKETLSVRCLKLERSRGLMDLMNTEKKQTTLIYKGQKYCFLIKIEVASITEKRRYKSL